MSIVSWFECMSFYLNYTGNGYKKVKFHVEGNISNYTVDQIRTIKETVAAIVGCDNEEIHLNGFCNSTSFFLVLLIKERYVNGLLNMKQQDGEKLVNLNINYIIVDSNHVYLKYPKGNFICKLDLKTHVRFSDHFFPESVLPLVRMTVNIFTYLTQVPLGLLQATLKDWLKVFFILRKISR